MGFGSWFKYGGRKPGGVCEFAGSCSFSQAEPESRLVRFRKDYCEEGYFGFCARYVVRKQIGYAPDSLLPDQHYLVPLIVSMERNKL
jgi:hypothetical protein